MTWNLPKGALGQAREVGAVEHDQCERVQHGRLCVQIDQAVERMRAQIAGVEQLHLAPVEHHRHAQPTQYVLVPRVDCERDREAREPRMLLRPVSLTLESLT